MSSIENIARVFVLKDNHVLLCKVKTKSHWFFPGGHVELGETTRAALLREIKEELNNELEDVELVGIQENTFSDERGEHQEVNIIFSAKIKDENIKCCEGHLEFCWLSLDKVKETDIKPETMKEAFLRWVENKEMFYSE